MEDTEPPASPFRCPQLSSTLAAISHRQPVATDVILHSCHFHRLYTVPG